MSKTRIVFCGEKPLGAKCLDLLRSWPQVEIVAACTRGEGKVWWGRQVFREYCTQNNVPICKRGELRALQYDFLVSVLYPFVIEAEHIERAGQVAVNLHEAPLPRWRGCNGYAHAILMGDETYGTTLHELAPALDTGRNIAIETFSILPNETVKELYDRTTETSGQLFEESMPRVLAGELSPIDESLDEESFLNARESLSGLKQLAPEMTPGQIYRHARAFDFAPWEPAYWNVEGRKHYVYVGDSAARKTELLDLLPRYSVDEMAGQVGSGKVDCFVAEGLQRPLVVCDEGSYRQYYSLI